MVLRQNETKKTRQNLVVYLPPTSHGFSFYLPHILTLNMTLTLTPTLNSPYPTGTSRPLKDGDQLPFRDPSYGCVYVKGGGGEEKETERETEKCDNMRKGGRHG